METVLTDLITEGAMRFESANGSKILIMELRPLKVQEMKYTTLIITNDDYEIKVGQTFNNIGIDEKIYAHELVNRYNDCHLFRTANKALEKINDELHDEINRYKEALDSIFHEKTDLQEFIEAVRVIIKDRGR